jgi:hypothetical protein
VIDALQNGAQLRACLMENGAICVVDVAVAPGRGTDEFAANLKLACYGSDIVLFAHGQSLFG